MVFKNAFVQKRIGLIKVIIFFEQELKKSDHKYKKILRKLTLETDENSHRCFLTQLALARVAGEREYIESLLKHLNNIKT